MGYQGSFWAIFSSIYRPVAAGYASVNQLGSQRCSVVWRDRCHRYVTRFPYTSLPPLRCLSKWRWILCIDNASGDLHAFGTKADDSPWKIGIANPDNPTQMLLYVPLTNASVATSGDYEQHFIYKGKRYSHTTIWPEDCSSLVYFSDTALYIVPKIYRHTVSRWYFRQCFTRARKPSRSHGNRL